MKEHEEHQGWIQDVWKGSKEGVGGEIHQEGIHFEHVTLFSSIFPCN